MAMDSSRRPARVIRHPALRATLLAAVMALAASGGTALGPTGGEGISISVAPGQIIHPSDALAPHFLLDPDGQVLVLNDMLGFEENTPSFVKKYAEISDLSVTAIKNFVKDIKEGDFPAKENVYNPIDK